MSFFKTISDGVGTGAGVAWPLTSSKGLKFFNSKESAPDKVIQYKTLLL